MRRHRQLFAAAAVLGLSATPALAQTSSTTSTSTTALTVPFNPIPATPPATTHPDQVISELNRPATTHPDLVVSQQPPATYLDPTPPNETSTAPRTAQPAVPSAPRQVALTG